MGVENLHLTSILLCFVGAALAPGLFAKWGAKSALALALIPLSIFLFYVRFLPMDPQNQFLEIHPWFPAMGFQLSFLLDGLSLLFVLLISGIGFFVFIYSSSYFEKEKKGGRLLSFLMIFMGAMLGLVLSENLFGLFIFWELTSISSFLLIGFKSAKEEARRSAQTALIVTAVGGLFLLAGFILLFEIGRSFGLQATQAGEISWLFRFPLGEHPWFAASFFLILMGALTKSAQFPFHFWLPAAMTAPSPVSSYLHSATMVKAGVYLLARFYRGYGESEIWFWTLCSFGLVTFLLGAVLALGFRDLKRILAYSTVSILGALVFLIGVGTETTLAAAIVLLVAHALYKAPLFQIAGAIELQTGERDITKLKGLWRSMPWLGTATVLAAFSQWGLPLLFGFFGKELVYAGLWEANQWVFLAVSFVANSFLGAVALCLFFSIFTGKDYSHPEAKEAPTAIFIGPLLLGVISLLLSLFPGHVGNLFSNAALSSILGYVNSYELHYWHGWEWKPVLVWLLSIATLGAAYLLYSMRASWIPRVELFLKEKTEQSPTHLYQKFFDSIFPFAEKLTGQLQHGYLNRYMTVVVGVFVVGVWLVLGHVGFPRFEFDKIEWSVFSVGLMALPVLGGVFVLRAPSQLAAVACLGITGVGVALLYSIFSAPDLSITQIMVEILTVLLLLFVFYHLPKHSKRSPRGNRVFQFVISVMGAVGIVFLLMLSLEPYSTRDLTEYFNTSSVPLAYGRNIVNVILVDFRALDTLGEVIVVSVAGMGVYALLKNSWRGRRKGTPE